MLPRSFSVIHRQRKKYCATDQFDIFRQHLAIQHTCVEGSLFQIVVVGDDSGPISCRNWWRNDISPHTTVSFRTPLLTYAKVLQQGHVVQLNHLPWIAGVNLEHQYPCSMPAAHRFGVATDINLLLAAFCPKIHSRNQISVPPEK